MTNNELRAAIDLAIKSNGAREITGPVLNDILNDVVDTYELRDVTIFNQDSTPTANRPGDLWYAPTAEQFSIWDGVLWDDMTISANKLYQPDGTNAFVYTDNTGKLTIDGALDLTGATTIVGATDITGTLNINGDIYQNGAAYETHAQQLYTTKDLIITRDGAVVGLGVGEYTGFQAKLYDGTNDGQLVFDKDGWARVGDVGALQKIATIEETSNDEGISFYDSATNKLVTSSDLLYSSGVLDIKKTSTAAIDVVLKLGTSGNGGIGVGTAIDLEVPGSASKEEGARIAAVATGGATITQSADLSFYTAKTGVLSEGMRLDEDGNLGINTDAPDQKLHVAGVIKADDNTYNTELSGTRLQYSRNSANYVSCGTVGGYLIFDTNGDGVNHAMVIGTTNKVGINTTGGGAQLQVKAAGTSSSANVFRLDDSTNAAKFYIRENGYVFSPPTYAFTTASAANMYVATDGSFRRSTSSRLIKENITYDINPKLALGLKPTPFTEISTGNQQLGFIAEDSDEVDSRFATNQEEDGMMGIDTTAMLAATLATVQAQEKRIIMLEDENISLKSRLDAIEAKINL